jgi:uncharacterized protein (TIGR00369 family)
MSESHDVAPRERRYIWNDPTIVSSAFLGRTGMEAMQALLSGEIPDPPIVTTMAMRLVRVDDGVAVFSFTPQEWMCNPMGVIHGGILATVLDTALTCCVVTRLSAEKAATTTDLQVRYLRPIYAGGPEIFAEATALHVGSTFATADARATDASGKLYAHATTGLALIRPADFRARAATSSERYT